MFINNPELNNHPFTASSTLILNSSGYKMPVDVLEDASFTPFVDNNPPYYLSDILRLDDSSWLWTVRDSSAAVILNIVFQNEANELPSSIQGEYYIGYGISRDRFCGTCIGPAKLKKWLSVIPSILEIPTNSFVFTSSAIRPLGYSDNRGNLIYGENIVNSVNWGNHITTTDGVSTVPYEVIDDTPESYPITKIIVNGKELTDKQLHIIPSHGSKIRVATSNSITIGKLTDLP